MVDLGSLTLAHFEPLVGQTFAVDDEHYRENLVLVEARALADRSGHGRAAGSFLLTFHGTSTTHIMEQGIRRFRHEALGEMEIAIAPRARLENGTTRYNALFD